MIPETFPGVLVSGFDPRGELLWDGNCRTCRALAGHCTLPNQPVQAALERLPESVRRTAAHQMLWVEPDGSIYGGSEAYLRMLRREGRPALAWLLGNPLVRPLTWLGYRLVVRWRQ